MPSLPVTPFELAAALGLVVVGAVIQGSIGFGLAVVVAPVLMLINPVFLPAPMLIAAMLLTSLVGFRERRHIHWPEVGIGTVGRVIGMIPAAFAIRYLSQSAYDLLFSSAVLFGVIVSLLGWHCRLSLRNLYLAAIGSGFASTVSAIGGPPLAIVYQHAEAPKIRGTLSAIFTIGSPISLIGLWWAGRFGRVELMLGLLMTPAILVGFLFSRFTADRLHDRHTRPAVLALSGMTAIMVMTRALVRLL